MGLDGTRDARKRRFEVSAVDTAAVRALYDRYERREAEETGMRREEAPGVVRLVDLWGDHSAIIYSELDAGSAGGAIRREKAHFAALGHELEWKLFAHDGPPDLACRLEEQGFRPEEPETVLALDLAQAPANLLAPVSADVRVLRTPSELADLTRVRSAVWPDDAGWLEERLSYMLRREPERMSVYVVYEGGEPVCAGRIQFPRQGGFAGIWGGATVPAKRRRGYYTALLAVRVQEALRRGMRYVTIDAGPMSLPIVAKHGFCEIARTQAFVRPAAEA